MTRKINNLIAIDPLRFNSRVNMFYAEQIFIAGQVKINFFIHVCICASHFGATL